MRENVIIDYTQLGLSYKLFNCEVLFNRGICHLFMGKDEPGTADLYSAQKEKRCAEHDVIDQAIAEGVDDLTVFSIPSGLLFCPPAEKVKNAGTVDYLGSPVLIAAVERSDMFIGFKGPYVRKAANVTAGPGFGSASALMLTRSATAPTNSTASQRMPANGSGRRARANSTGSAPVPGPSRGSAAGSHGRTSSRASPITVSTIQRTSSSSAGLAIPSPYLRTPPTIESPNHRTSSHRGFNFSVSGDNVRKSAFTE
ncbi:MAG: hypothetical protein BJ554DRAFT_4708 [Olpidium bornovanus]|uniref:Uncharacterized protein n=1 Tax=Olpidium bornovanus TaxID=278681 RepID=A0A8H7ZZZ9_9FUNG|nr:MAG: hypothetical protein BJ554DRAFT_4708 [Olpidium bornovanus]